METCQTENDSLDLTLTILALDQSLNNTGYSIFTISKSNGVVSLSDKHQILTTTGVIKPKTKLSYVEKLHFIQSNLSLLLDKYNPDYVFFEEIFTVGKGAWRKLIEVRIIIELLLYQRSLKYAELSPLINRKNSWRKINGLTSSDKKEWQQLIQEKNEHIADSIGIGLAGIYLIQHNML